MLSFGNTSIKDMYYGSIKIGSAYLGSTKVYSSVPTSTSPYLLFQFDDSSYRPSIRTDVGTWERISTSPNVWKFTCDPYVPQGVGDTRTGWARLFSDDSGAGSGQPIYRNCSIIGGGNLNNSDLINLYVAFSGSTGIKSISLLQFSQARDVSGLFRDCTNVESGALAMYNYLSSLPNIDSHADTFKNCGSYTQTGLAELNQIPVGWGGNLIPASTLMTSSRVKWKNNYDTWKITANAPDWTNMNGLYLFTEASVSSYAGVSMNRSRIATFNSLSTSRNALYFYPCFMQHTSTAITWAVTTGSPNGSLAYNQSNTDMPGTLDYTTYGSFAYEFGTYDSAGTVYFCFFVTDVPISSSFNLSSSPYGVLYNSNFKTNGGFRYFF